MEDWRWKTKHREKQGGSSVSLPVNDESNGVNNIHVNFWFRDDSTEHYQLHQLKLGIISQEDSCFCREKHALEICNKGSEQLLTLIFQTVQKGIIFSRRANCYVDK